MRPLWHRYRKLVWFSVITVLMLGLFWSLGRYPYVQMGIGSKLIDSSRGPQRLMVDMAGGISDFFYRHFSDAASYTQVLRLRAELAKAKTSQILLVDAQKENAELKRLLHVTEYLEGPKPLLGQIIGRTGTPLSRVIRLDIGKQNGVNRGDAVISEQGVVGQVIAVGQHACDVLLVTDSSSAIDVVVQRSRARGIVRGKSNTNRYGIRIEDFDRLQDVQVGDVVVTSGIGAKFPEGVPVGQITKVIKTNDGVYLQAELKPFTEFARMEHVLVLLRDKEDRPWRMKEIVELQAVQPDVVTTSMMGEQTP